MSFIIVMIILLYIKGHEPNYFMSTRSHSHTHTESRQSKKGIVVDSKLA